MLRRPGQPAVGVCRGGALAGEPRPGSSSAQNPMGADLYVAECNTNLHEGISLAIGAPRESARGARWNRGVGDEIRRRRWPTQSNMDATTLPRPRGAR
jgi:hypothetical protein